MLCECFDKIKDKLREQNYIDAEIMNTGFTVDFKNGKTESLLNIPYSYKKINKNDEIMKKEFIINVFASYCPFCGKKIKD